MDRESGQDLFAGLKSGSEEYSVYDAHYERIGKVDDVFLDERDAVTYIGVEMGFFGTNSTLVPAEIVRVNDRRRLIEVAAEAETIKHASVPTTGWTPNRARGWSPRTSRAGRPETQWLVSASPRTAGRGRRRRMMLRSTAGGGKRDVPHSWLRCCGLSYVDGRPLALCRAGRIRRRQTGRMSGESVLRRN